MLVPASKRSSGMHHGNGSGARALDPYAARFLHMMSVGRVGTAAQTDRREALRDLARLAGPGPEHVATRDLLLSGAECPLAMRLYDSAPQRPERLAAGLFYVHGGGLVAGGLDTHDAVCRQLAAASGCRIIAVDYRLAPEHPFPAGLDDVVATYRAALCRTESLGIDPMRLAIGGDSAGAGLVALACLRLTNLSPRIPVQLLICPVLTVDAKTRSRQEFAQGHFLDAASVRRDAIDCGLSRLRDPFLELERADLSDMPPAIIHTAGFDMMRDEGGDHATRLDQAGVCVSHTLHASMIHYFYALGRLIPRSRDIVAAIGAELAAALNATPVAASLSLQERTCQ